MCSGIYQIASAFLGERGTVHRQPTKVSQAVLDGGFSSQLIGKAILKAQASSGKGDLCFTMEGFKHST